jgi:hypothetical protein
MSKMDAVLTTITGAKHNVTVDSDEQFTCKTLTDDTLWRFINTDGNAVFILGSKISTIVVKQ